MKLKNFVQIFAMVCILITTTAYATETFYENDTVLCEFAGVVRKARILEIENQKAETTTTANTYVTLDSLSQYKPVESIVSKSITDVMFGHPGHTYRIGDTVLAKFNGRTEEAQILDLTADKLVSTTNSAGTYIGLDRIEPISK